MKKYLKKSILLSLMLVISSSVLAQSSTQYYKTIVHILRYSTLSKQSTICVFNDKAVTDSFNQHFKQLNLEYSAIVVNADNFVRSNCQAVYFPNQSPKVQNDWINRYPTSILSFSSTNPQCEIGSAVCLSQGQNKINMAFNMDGLSRAKVSINPHVLKMAAGK
ncbi:YfiR family protein [Moraxella sp. ZY210820]|uniref:YfiR family protein n=1 Tax=unclassified Moraxella TaxID=2685852 RepID=UPI002730F3E8|nr:YfiR family protein [Moraxella sp. ZY210820]WLF83544.1 YfiR family protein [Moraxella sp. ZY210820]